MIEYCPLCKECRLVETVDLPANYLFIGEIVAAFAKKNCLREGRPDIEKINPLMLTMPDNRY
jgi:flavin reductase (DIM6/NTAB) family NADH-FMN oxidoreductase RutF